MWIISILKQILELTCTSTRFTHLLSSNLTCLFHSLPHSYKFFILRHMPFKAVSKVVSNSSLHQCIHVFLKWGNFNFKTCRNSSHGYWSTRHFFSYDCNISCGMPVERMDAMFHLPLALPPDDVPTTVQWCISNYFKPKLLDEYRCVPRNLIGCCVETKTLDPVPEVLIVHSKRVIQNGQSKKVNIIVGSRQIILPGVYNNICVSKAVKEQLLHLSTVHPKVPVQL